MSGGAATSTKAAGSGAAGAAAGSEIGAAAAAAESICGAAAEAAAGIAAGAAAARAEIVTGWFRDIFVGMLARASPQTDISSRMLQARAEQEPSAAAAQVAQPEPWRW